MRDFSSSRSSQRYKCAVRAFFKLESVIRRERSEFRSIVLSATFDYSRDAFGTVSLKISSFGLSFSYSRYVMSSLNSFRCFSSYDFDRGLESGLGKSRPRFLLSSRLLGSSSSMISVSIVRSGITFLFFSAFASSTRR